MVTLGLFAYELRGIQHCYILIAVGERFERALNIEGQFVHRVDPGPGTGAAFAGRVIYPVVLAAWLIVGLYKGGVALVGESWGPLLVGAFALSLALIAFVVSDRLLESAREQAEKIKEAAQQSARQSSGSQ